MGSKANFLPYKKQAKLFKLYFTSILFSDKKLALIFLYWIFNEYVWLVGILKIAQLLVKNHRYGV